MRVMTERAIFGFNSAPPRIIAERHGDAMPAAQTHAPLSYNKWDHFGEEDEDGPATSEPATPMLPSTKKDAQVDADNQMYERFRNYMKTYFKGKYPLAQRKLLARFIAVAHEGAEESNAFRYPDIMGLSSQVSHPGLRRTTPRGRRQPFPQRRLPFPSPRPLPRPRSANRS